MSASSFNPGKGIIYHVHVYLKQPSIKWLHKCSHLMLGCFRYTSFWPEGLMNVFLRSFFFLGLGTLGNFLAWFLQGDTGLPYMGRDWASQVSKGSFVVLLSSLTDWGLVPVSTTGSRASWNLGKPRIWW